MSYGQDTDTREAEWYVRLGGVRHPRLRLVCYPHAGGSGAMFASWPLRLDPGIELLAAQLPGRGDRRNEDPIESVPAMARSLADNLPPDDAPLALLGHSMGGMLAFEIARLRAQRRQPLPRHVFLSATPSPGAERRKPLLHTLSDEELMCALRRLDGPAIEMLDDPALASLVLPVVRADLRAVEQHRVTPGMRLTVPVTVFIGNEDADVGFEEVTAWREFTTGPFAIHAFPGGHFFPMTSADAVLRSIDTLLRCDQEPAVRATPIR